MAASICAEHGVIVLEQDKSCWACAESGVRARFEPLRVGNTTITGEPTQDGEYRVHLVQLRMCEGCLLGIGSECHTPGCAMWLHNSPFMPIHPELYEIVVADVEEPSPADEGEGEASP